MCSYTAVPEKLKAISHWVAWKLDPVKGKVPYDVKTARKAKTNDPSTWATFKQVVDAVDILAGNDYDGIGFVLLDTPLVGSDFDGMLHDGVAEPFALEILKHLGNPYCESSPSGAGLHAFVECAALPPGQRKFSKNHYGMEVYSGSEKGRFLTVTGQQFSGNGVPKIADIGLAYLLITQARNTKFKDLWMGDTAAYGDRSTDDPSSADLALVSILARLLNGDRARIEKYFGTSVLGQRDKWIDRPDYRRMTLDKALVGKSFNNGDANPTSATEPITVSVVSRTASSIKPKRLKWLWEKRIPLGKITLFAGNPDNGKSLAANITAAIVTAGRPFPDYPNMIPPSDVLMMLGEDDLEDTAIPRLMAAGADLDRIHFLEGVVRGNKPGDVKLDVDMHLLESKLQEFPNTRLLIIDPISNFLGDTNMFGEQDARAEVLVPLKNLAAKYNVAVLIIMHLNKKKDLDAISRVGGCMAFIGIARCSWLFQRDETSEDGALSDNFTMSRLKNNLTSVSVGGLSYKIEFNERVFQDEDGAVGAPYVIWGSVVYKSADQVLGNGLHEVGRPKGSDSKMKAAVEFLEDALADGRKPQTELLKDAQGGHDIKSHTLRRAKDEMGIKSVKDGKTWYWELSPMNETTETLLAGKNTEPVTTLLEVSL